MAWGESVAIGGTDLARKFDGSSGPRIGSKLYHQCNLHTQHHRQCHWLSIPDNTAGSPQAVSLSGAGISASAYRKEVAVLGPDPNGCCPAPLPPSFVLK